MALALSISPRHSIDDWLDWRTAVREHPDAEDPFARDIIATTAGSQDFTYSRELRSRDYNALAEIAPFEYVPDQLAQKNNSEAPWRTKVAVWLRRASRQTKQSMSGCSRMSGSLACCLGCQCVRCDAEDLPDAPDSSRAELFQRGLSASQASPVSLVP